MHNGMRLNLIPSSLVIDLLSDEEKQAHGAQMLAQTSRI